MESIRNQRETVRKSGMTFLRSEIDTAHTLADIALASAKDSEKRKRNGENARKAYESVKHFADRVSLTGDETRELNENLKALRSKLSTLGQKVD